MNKIKYRQLFVLIIIVFAIWAATGQDVSGGYKESKEADIYFTPFSHLDCFWGGTREECLSRGNRIIAKAIGFRRHENVPSSFWLDSGKMPSSASSSGGEKQTYT